MWLLAIIATMVCSLIASWVFYDLLINRFHSRRPMDWAEAGKPIGMLHVPSGGSILAGTITRYRLMNSLLFKTPKWIQQDAYSVTLLKWYRLTFGLYLSCIIGLFVFVVVALLLS